MKPRKRKGFLYVLLTAFAVVVQALGPASYACEPCPLSHRQSLDDTVKKSDIIVIGRRHNPPAFNDNKGNSGPAVITIEVERVLKGQPGRKRVKAASWYGMCAYGVILHKERALLLLKEGPTDQSGEVIYETVNTVCGESQFIVIDGRLTRKEMRGSQVEHVPFMSLDEFVEKYIGGPK